MEELARERIGRVARRMTDMGNETNLAEDCPISIIEMNRWEWAQGIGLYGLMRAYERTGDRNALACLELWFERRIAEGLPERNVNTMPDADAEQAVRDYGAGGSLGVMRRMGGMDHAGDAAHCPTTYGQALALLMLTELAEWEKEAGQ